MKADASKPDAVHDRAHGERKAASVKSALVTGTSRGIGLAFCRRLAAEGWQVIATARDPAASSGLGELARAHPERVELHALDVGDFAAVDALAAGLGERKIDLLVNNAAVQGPEYGEQGFGQSDYAKWLDVLRINALAPMKLMEAFVEHVGRGDRKLIVNVSSIMGSCGNPRFGGIYSYRTSKTLLNGITSTAACDLRERGISVVALHPGYVRTALGSPVAQDTPDDAIEKLWPLLEKLGPEQSGQFLDWDGSVYPW